MKCPNCGSESSGKFCAYCGAPLPQSDSNQTDYQTPPNSSQGYYQGNSRQQDSYQQSWQQTSEREDRRSNGYQTSYSYSQGSPDIPPEYRPISMWGYFGYQILFSIPCVGFILLLIFSFGGTQNINLRNFARSYFCLLIIVVVLMVFVIGISGGFAMLNLH